MTQKKQHKLNSYQKNHLFSDKKFLLPVALFLGVIVIGAIHYFKPIIIGSATSVGSPCDPPAVPQDNCIGSRVVHYFCMEHKVYESDFNCSPSQYCLIRGGKGGCVDNSPPYCGDLTCNTGYGEDTTSCPIDCHYCGDRICGGGEYYSCPQDCTLGTCPNGICEPSNNENTANCPQDCKTNPPTPQTCTDTDGIGIIYPSIPGTLTDTSAYQSGVFKDKCLSPTSVREYYCTADGGHSYSDTPCSQVGQTGCFVNSKGEGFCGTDISNGCKDSDKGYVPTDPGTLTDKTGKTHKDTCYQDLHYNTDLTEYSCKTDGSYSGSSARCPSGTICKTNSQGEGYCGSSTTCTDSNFMQTQSCCNAKAPLYQWKNNQCLPSCGEAGAHYGDWTKAVCRSGKTSCSSSENNLGLTYDCTNGACCYPKSTIVCNHDTKCDPGETNTNCPSDCPIPSPGSCSFVRPGITPAGKKDVVQGCTVKRYWKVDFVMNDPNCNPSSLGSRQIYLVTGGKKSSYIPSIKSGSVVEIWSEFDKGTTGKHEVIDKATGKTSGTAGGPNNPDPTHCHS